MLWANCRAMSALTLLLGISSLTAHAQVTTADIVGRVTDSTGAVLSGVKVMVENLGTLDSRSVQTNTEGDYVFTLLPIGSYTVRIEAKGLKTFSVPGFGCGGTRVGAGLDLS
jgi:hypothetical protein